MVPQYMVCTLILSEHNKDKEIGLITQIFQGGCVCVCNGIVRFFLWEKWSTIWRSFFNKWIGDRFSDLRWIHFNIYFSSIYTFLLFYANHISIHTFLFLCAFFFLSQLFILDYWYDFLRLFFEELLNK